MNHRRMAVMVAVLAMFAVLSPLMVSDSEAVDPIDVTVSSADGKDIVIDIESGESKSIQIFVTNKTDKYLSMTSGLSGTSEDLTGSLSTNVNGATSSLIGPAGTDTCIAVITMTLKADPYADNDDVAGSLDLRFVDIGDPAVTPLEVSKPVTVHITSVFTTGDSYNKFFGIFPNTLGEPFDSVWVTALITFILWIVGTIIASEIIIPLLCRLVGFRKTEEEKKALTKKLTSMITALMIVIAINECARIVGADAELMHLVGAISAVIYVVLFATISWQVYLFIVTAFLRGMDEKADVDGMDMSLLPLFRMIGKLVITVVSVCVALAAFGVDLAGILVSAGVVSLGITLGAQNILNQFFSGIVLLSTRPFKKGDFVMVNNVTYIVRKVKVMYTEFLNWDKDQVVTMPNNVVSSATLVNLTREYHGTRVFAYVDVAYDSDVEKVKKCLEDAGRKHPHVISDGTRSPPGARLIGFGSSGIQFRLACYVDDYDNSSHYCGQIRELIFKELNDNGVEIPYSRIQVDILSDVVDNRRDLEPSA